MSKELKHPISYQKQIQLLKSRGLIIEDEKYAYKILSNISYYRMINAYSVGLIHNDKYDNGVSFNQILELYEFDSRLRFLIFEQIENIEIMLRTKIAYYLSNNYCCTCYLLRDLYEDENKFNIFMSDFSREVKHQRSNLIVEHYKKQYNSTFPLWVAIEFFSFGMLSKFFANLKSKDKNKICDSLPHWETEKSIPPFYLESWLQSLVDVRNICAHSGRIYNRKLTSYPKLFREHNYLRNDKIFATLYVAKRITPNKSHWNTFVNNIKVLFDNYNSVNLNWMEFPKDWEDLLYIKD